MATKRTAVFLRLPPELVEALKVLAEKNHRTLTRELEHILVAHVEKEKR